MPLLLQTSTRATGRRSATRTVWVFAVLGGLAQALSGSAGGLLAEHVGGTAAVAGLPQSVLVLGSAAAAVLLSDVARRRGRAVALSGGTLTAAAGCGVVVAGAVGSALWAVLVGSCLLGAGNTAVMLSRYAGAELGPETERARSLAAVLAATTVGAVAGPNLLAPSAGLDRLGVPGLAGAYVVAGLTYLAASAVILRCRAWLTRRSRLVLPSVDGGGAASALGVLTTANLVMVAVMTMAPVHLHHMGSGLGVIGLVVSVHIAGMFAPSPVSGWLAQRLGSPVVARLAFGVLAAACAGAALTADSPPLLGLSMLGLGVGWNLALVAGSDLLTRGVPPADRPRREGLGEVWMGLAAAGGGVGSSVLLDAASYRVLAVAGLAVAVLVLAALATNGDGARPQQVRSR